MQIISQQHMMSLLLTFILWTLYQRTAVVATSLDLENSCRAKSLLKTCILTNVTATFDDPLWVSNATLAHLQELVIRDSAMAGIPTSILDKTPNLESLQMINCRLNRLYSGDFQNNDHLQKLVLQFNRLFDVPENAFSALGNSLEQLHLSQNNIHILHRRSLAGLQKLWYLEARSNGIRSLQGGIFEEIINLQYLDLSFNEIEVIDGATFSYNTKLSTLILSNNKFSVFQPNSLSHLLQLRFLDLSNTVLDELELQAVDVLYVQGSGLKHFQLTGGVITVNASNNALTGFDITNKLMVQHMDIHKNVLVTLKDVQGMTNLQSLDVSSNKLRAIKTNTTSMLYLPNLQQLNIASNLIRNLSLQDFMYMTQLSSLDLAYNPIFHLEVQAFEPLLNLHKLYLESDHLLQFDYVGLTSSHEFLQEIAVNHNDFDWQYLENMTYFLQDHGIHLVKRLKDNSPYMPQTYAQNRLSAESLDNEASQRLIGLASIHPYWTLRDILAIITLIIVLFIMLLQLYHILQEEQCCRRFRVLEDDDMLEPLNSSHHRLVEHNSSV